MKKYLIIIFIFFATVFSGCNITTTNFKTQLEKKKPNNYYYTTLFAQKLVYDEKCYASVIDTNFYKEKTLSSEDITSIRNFVKELKKEDFSTSEEDKNLKPLYKIIFSFDKEKFVICVYNKDLATIYPWDGNFKTDILNMKNISISNNPYFLCNYIVKEHGAK